MAGLPISYWTKQVIREDVKVQGKEHGRVWNSGLLMQSIYHTYISKRLLGGGHIEIIAKSLKKYRL